MNPRQDIVKAIIHQSELDFIEKWILDYPDLETGGDFFGYWQDGVPVIEFVIGPGKNARRTSTSFYQDIEYLKMWGNLINRFDHKLKHIGAWHSHHRLSLAHPSGGDINTMRNALQSNGLSKFLISIGNINSSSKVSVNGFLFIKDLPQDYLHCPWDVKNGTSPIRQQLNKDPNLISVNPIEHEQFEVKTSINDQVLNNTLHNEVEIQKPTLEEDSFWLKLEGRKFLKNAFNEISRDRFVQDAEILQLEDGRLAIVFNYFERHVRITFPLNFPTKQPQVTMNELADVGLLENIFQTNKRIEKKIMGIIYSSGVLDKNQVIPINYY